jgi:DNA-binding transcriptional LysR family regulator
MVPEVELYQIQYFLAVAESLNFTRAAEQCNVSQPSLTKAIQKLEHELGGNLLHRERQLTHLTDLGKLLRPMLENTLAAAQAVRRRALDFQQRTIAPLRIGLGDCISASLLADCLAEAADQLPGLQIETISANTRQLLSSLLDGDINVLVAADDGQELVSRIDFWPLFNERFLLLTARGIELTDAESVSIETLKRMVWLEHLGCAEVRRFWENCLSNGERIQIRHRSRHMDHLQHMVEANLGVLLLPEHAPYLPTLSAHSIIGDPIRREVRLFVVSGRRYSPALEVFLRVVLSRPWVEKS